MASAAAVATIASTAVGIGSTISAQRDQRKAEREQRRAAELEQRRAAIENARQRRQAAAQAQIQRAQVEAGAAGMGGSTTGTSQTTGAITSQTAGNISFQRTLEGINQQSIQAQQRANDFMSSAARTQALGQLPSQLGFSPGSMISNFDAMSAGFSSLGQRFGGGQQSFLQRNPGAGQAGVGGVFA